MTTAIAAQSQGDELQVIDHGTGELVEQQRPADPYAGLSVTPVDDAQAAILERPCDADDLDILPTGEVYLPQVGYRRRLNEAFRPGGWAMRPLGPPTKVNATLMQEWALYVLGRFIASTWGEADYHEDNTRQSYATALESLKSNALMRCCKDLGIASECWDRPFTERWKADRAVKVWRAEAKRRGGEKGEYQWRRTDATPFYDEDGTADTKPQTRDTLDAEAQERGAPAKPQPTVELPTGHETWPENVHWITSLSAKKGTGAKGAWVRTTVQTHRGKYTTFDEKKAKTAHDAKAVGRPVLLESKPAKDAKYDPDIVTIEPFIIELTADDIPF